MITTIAGVFIAGLCWGSFVNVLASRILHGRNFWAPRSHCPACGSLIAWYDNIPLLSFVLLKARCRSCKQAISWLYPAVELAAGVLAVVLLGVTTHPYIYAAYAFFCTMLLAATRTDLEAMLIPRLFSLGLVPCGLLAAGGRLTAVSLFESALGAFVGYAILWLIAKCFLLITKREGMGVGDYDLLAGIGAWIGPVGVWLTLMLGSSIGLLCGSVFIYCSGKTRGVRIPFGPFLALGAVLYLVFSKALLSFFLIP